MGRWCRFTTGIEYKFWFGVQSSIDVEAFGGDWLRNWNYNPVEWDEQYLDGCEDENEKNEMRDTLFALKEWANGRDDFNRADIESCPLKKDGIDITDYIDWGHQWTGVSYESVLEKCKAIQPKEGITLDEDSQDLDKYLRSFPASEEGTHELLNDLDGNVFDDDEENKELQAQQAKWMFGCVLAHQLLYDDDLRCNYDE